eukprot:TRINITY_DN8387_c0_g1_i1.p1 TRINITY_DN8387_c0_g1~~TRINITY_DN8387_c0_g1_i1.p1  ORF type:complete len:651 (-),score=100.65 TRINITY_DN8387_c0_g1_i1:289-2241(-)
MFFEDPWQSKRLQLVLLARRGIFREMVSGEIKLELSPSFPFAILHDSGNVGPATVHLSTEQLGFDASQFVKSAFENSTIFQRYCARLSKPVSVQLAKLPDIPTWVAKALEVPVPECTPLQCPGQGTMPNNNVKRTPSDKAISRESRSLARGQALLRASGSKRNPQDRLTPPRSGAMDLNGADIEWVTKDVSSAKYRDRKLSIGSMPCKDFLQHDKLPFRIPLLCDRCNGREHFLLPDSARIVRPHGAHSHLEMSKRRHAVVFQSKDAVISQVDFLLQSDECQSVSDSQHASMAELLSLGMPGLDGFRQKCDVRTSPAFNIAISPHCVVNAFFQDGNSQPALHLALMASVGVQERPGFLAVEEDSVLAILHIAEGAKSAVLFAGTQEQQALDFFQDAFQSSISFQEYCQTYFQDSGSVPDFRLAGSREEECKVLIKTFQAHHNSLAQGSAHVEGGDPAEGVRPDIAASLTRELWASRIEYRLSHFGGHGSDTGALQRRFMVLRFSRNPGEFDAVLLNCDVALEAAERGAELKPPWGNGAKIFVEGVEPADFDMELSPSHVVVREEDKDRILDALRALPYDSRPRLKPGQSLRTHDPATLLRVVSDEGDHDIDNDASSAPLLITVQNTFIHIPEKPSSASSSTERPKSWGPP